MMHRYLTATIGRGLGRTGLVVALLLSSPVWGQGPAASVAVPPGRPAAAGRRRADAPWLRSAPVRPCQEDCSTWDGPPGPVDSLLGPVVDADSFLADSPNDDSPWTWQVLPDGLIYRSYLAGPKEPRIAGTFFHEKDQGWLLDIALGGRVGILRLGTADSGWPQGWQLDVEGAGFPRLNLDQNWDLQSADFRFGVPLTYGVGPFQTKVAYYHLSSHLGDELLVRNRRLLASRINFSRDTLVVGWSTYPNPSWRIYNEVGWAFASDGGSQPWELQFGTEWSPPGSIGVVGAPFVAVNVHLREEVDFGGNFVLETGWQSRGITGHLFRVGLHYLNGKSNQFEFFNESEQQLGLGFWYDY